MKKISIPTFIFLMVFQSVGISQEWNYNNVNFVRGQVTLKDRYGQDRTVQMNEEGKRVGVVASTPSVIVIDAGTGGVLGDLESAYLTNAGVKMLTSGGYYVTMPLSEFQNQFDYTEYTAAGPMAYEKRRAYNEGYDSYYTIAYMANNRNKGYSSNTTCADTNNTCPSACEAHWRMYDIATDTYSTGAIATSRNQDPFDVTGQWLTCSALVSFYLDDFTDVPTGTGRVYFQTLGRITNEWTKSNTAQNGGSYDAAGQLATECIKRVRLPNGQIKDLVAISQSKVYPLLQSDLSTPPTMARADWNGDSTDFDICRSVVAEHYIGVDAYGNTFIYMSAHESGASDIYWIYTEDGDVINGATVGMVDPAVHIGGVSSKMTDHPEKSVSIGTARKFTFWSRTNKTFSEVNLGADSWQSKWYEDITAK